MRLVDCTESDFRNDFLPMIIDLWCGDKYNPQNSQHVEWLDKKIHASFDNFGTAICAYTDENEPIGYLWYQHDANDDSMIFYIKKKFIPVAYHPGEDGVHDLGQVYLYKVL